MHALRCFKTTTASLIEAARAAGGAVLCCAARACVFVCVCARGSRCKPEKANPAGCLQTAGSSDFYSRRRTSFPPLRLTCSPLSCVAQIFSHTHWAHTCSACLLRTTALVSRFFFLLLFFPPKSLTQIRSFARSLVSTD